MPQKAETIGKVENLKENLKTLPDGSVVEGLAVGGKVLIVRQEPEFRRNILPYFTSTIMIIVAMVMVFVSGNFYLPFFVMYIFSPLQNHFGVGDNKNLSPKSQLAFAKDKRFDLPLQIFIIFDNFITVWALIIMSDDINPKGYLFNTIQRPETNSDYFGFALIISFFTAICGVSGHELIHHKELHNKVIGIWPLTKFCYTQFLDEHLKGHHKLVSTYEDGATARKNETVYAFVFRNMYTSITHVWQFETEKIDKWYGKDCNILTRIFCNKLVCYEILHASILFGVYSIFGWSSLKFYLCYIVIGLLWHETVNYIEHYGILRKKDANGVNESINKMHSWNQLSGAVMARLQRHSDHHEHGHRPYQILRRMDDAPFMPFEYLHIYMLAAFPPIFFYVMNPRVEALDDIKHGRKNEKGTQWNNMMPPTEDDVFRKRVGWVYILTIQCLLAYLSFF